MSFPQQSTLLRKINNPLKLQSPSIFTKKMIMSLFIPVLIEEIMIAFITIADTAMVSYAGEAAVAGISLVATVNTVIKQIINALAMGAGVIVSQYIGKKDEKNTEHAMKMGLYSSFFMMLIISLLWLVLNKPFISLMFGNVEEAVFNSAVTYMSLSLISYPFLAIYYSGAVFFRAKGNGKLPMLSSLIMMGVNLIIKAILIYGFNMGVMGAGISTVVSATVISIFILYMMIHRDSIIHIKQILKIRFDFAMIKRILGIGVPAGIEKSLFQFGILLLHRVTATFGTAALAANAIAKSITPLSYIIGQSFALVIINIVGRCMGAGKPDEATMYTKYILKLNYVLGFVINVICIALAVPIISLYNLSPEASKLSAQIFITYCAGSIIAYPISTVLPLALRGAGDAKFCMITSGITMFTIRIAMAYVLGLYMNLGVFGVWLSMILEWFVKGMIFYVRFVKGKWKKIKVI
jgi:putative MATE family efflux protein